MSSSTISNPTANPTVTTTYTLTATNTASGCTATDSIDVSVNTTVPTANAGTDFTKSCSTNASGAQIGSTAVTGVTYLWSPTTGLSSSTASNPTANPTVTTTYTLTATNTASGCTATDTVVVTVETDVVAANAGTDFTKSCTSNTNGKQIGASSVTGVTYSWNSGQSTQTITTSTAGTFIVTVTNSVSGCSSLSAALTVNNSTPYVPVCLVTVDSELQNNFRHVPDMKRE